MARTVVCEGAKAPYTIFYFENEGMQKKPGLGEPGLLNCLRGAGN